MSRGLKRAEWKSVNYLGALKRAGKASGSLRVLDNVKVDESIVATTLTRLGVERVCSAADCLSVINFFLVSFSRQLVFLAIG